MQSSNRCGHMRINPFRRRDFIKYVCGTAFAWPLAVRAQQPGIPVIGFLHPLARESVTERVDAFLLGLKENGFEEGRNVAIEFRWAQGQYDQLPSLAHDLVNRRVSVILTGSTPAAIA